MNRAIVVTVAAIALGLAAVASGPAWPDPRVGSSSLPAEAPHSFAIRLVVGEADDPEDQPPLPGAVRAPQVDGVDLWLVGPDILTADIIVDAVSALDLQTGLPEVNVRISEEGQRRFAEATRKYVGWQMAIVIDGVVVSAPYISTPIDQQDIAISGTFTLEEANDLAQAILKSRTSSKP